MRCCGKPESWRCIRRIDPCCCGSTVMYGCGGGGGCHGKGGGGFLGMRNRGHGCHGASYGGCTGMVAYGCVGSAPPVVVVPMGGTPVQGSGVVPGGVPVPMPLKPKD